MITAEQRKSLPCYLITYAQPERMVMGYTHDRNVIRWFAQHMPESYHLQFTYFSSIEELDDEIDTGWDPADSRVFSNELTSDWIRGVQYPPMFVEDDVTGDVAWEWFERDADKCLPLLKKLAEFIKDKWVRDIILNWCDIIEWCIDETNQPKPTEWWNNQNVDDELIDQRMVVCRMLMSEEGGNMYYYGDY